MKKTLKIGLSWLAISAFALCGMTATAQNDYTKRVNRPYEEVLAAVKQAAQKQGFRVSNVHDIAASLRKDGIDRPPYATVEVCNSKIAAQVLNSQPLLGSVMPCRIAVFQQDKETTVSMILPSKMMTMFPIDSDVKKAAKQVETSMKAIVDEATR